MPFNPLTGRYELDTSLWQLGTDPRYPQATGQAIGDIPSSLMADAAREYWEQRTPEMDWERMLVDLPADPRWQWGLQSLQPQLQSRYLLAQPFMPPGAGAGTSFSQFLSDIGTAPGYRVNREDLLRRASLAARIAQMPVGQTAEGLLSPTEQAYYGMFGGGTQEAIANQRAVANLIARQRMGPGGGQYRGRLGSAIDKAMGAMYRARQAKGAPETSFLDWYLRQRGTAPGTLAWSPTDRFIPTTTTAGQEIAGGEIERQRQLTAAQYAGLTPNQIGQLQGFGSSAVDPVLEGTMGDRRDWPPTASGAYQRAAGGVPDFGSTPYTPPTNGYTPTDWGWRQQGTAGQERAGGPAESARFMARTPSASPFALTPAALAARDANAFSEWVDPALEEYMYGY